MAGLNNQVLEELDPLIGCALLRTRVSFCLGARPHSLSDLLICNRLLGYEASARKMAKRPP